MCQSDLRQTVVQWLQRQLVPLRRLRACRSGSWCHTAASSTLQDAATQNKRKRETGNPDNIGARLQSKARMQAPVQGKLPGSSAGGASAAAGSSGRANGEALPAAVKPEDEAKEQGNAALKQGDYDQVLPMPRLQMLVDGVGGAVGGALQSRLELGRLVLCRITLLQQSCKDEAEEQGNAALRWRIPAHLPYAAAMCKVCYQAGGVHCGLVHCKLCCRTAGAADFDQAGLILLLWSRCCSVTACRCRWW